MKWPIRIWLLNVLGFFFSPFLRNQVAAMGVVEGSQRLSACINNSFPLTSASMLGLWFRAKKKVHKLLWSWYGPFETVLVDCQRCMLDGAKNTFQNSSPLSCLLKAEHICTFEWQIFFNYFLWPVEVWESIFRFSKDCSRIYRAGLTEGMQTEKLRVWWQA